MFMPDIFGDDLFDDLFNGFVPATKQSGRINVPATNVMRTDILESDNAFELQIDLPGYKKEDVTAKLDDGYLTVKAEKKENKEDKDKKLNFLRRERFYGSCSRSFYVGDDVTQEDIKAKFEDGILKITVPKIEKKPEVEENKYIAIEG
ncbi:MAG: Hsp20/alpha crystallin family protein [Lachnospiraceae bacterium]|nr:Hsp20/alpha crystallin family protein [Lachnospiraceae bacterium]